MQILPLKTWPVRISAAALALATAAAISAAAAQEGLPANDAAQAPAITLPPLPDAPVKLDSAAPDAAAVVTPKAAPTADSTTSKAADSALAPAPAPVPAAETKPAAAASAAPQVPAAADSTTSKAADSAPAPIVAPATASVPEPAPALPVLDAALKDRLDALSKSDVPHLTAAQRKVHEEIAAFYAARDYAPVWRTNGGWTAAAKSALKRLEHADEDALDLKLSTLPVLAEGEPSALAATELSLSQAIVAYGQLASSGRIDPHAISQFIDEKPPAPVPAQILGAVANATDADAALENFNPPQAGYKALRQKLAEIRHEHTPVAAAQIPGGPDLKVGMKDPRVPLIRARFSLDTEPATAPSDLVYDTRIATAVANFQRSKGLPISGTLTARTIAALSGGQPSRLENEILVNMELWRWLPREIGSDRVDVNIPDFTVELVRDDKVVHKARVVVGKPDTPTPVFSNAMQYLELNPYWNVPQSIIKKEMLPHLAQDPNYLQRQGYEVTTKHGQLIVRQPPGERNALGRIKFMFPNDHAVYLHDTPAKALFNTSRRAYSHGCVRVDQPLALAELVLGKESGWTQAKLQSLIGGNNRTIHLPKALPVHIEYFTAWVDDGGKLQLRDDIYGYSHKMKLALGLQD